MWTFLGYLAAAIIGGAAGLIANRRNNKSVQETQESTNQFNQAQYEDWKEYSNFSSRLQRAEDAGVSPFAALQIDDSVSSPFQIGSQEAPHSGIGDFGAMLANGISGGISAQLSRNERKQQFAFEKHKFHVDQQYQQELLRIKKEQVAALKKHNDAMEQNWDKNLEYKYYAFDSNYDWTQTFYNNPMLPGYWQVQNAMQNYGYNKAANPYFLAKARSEAQSSGIKAKHADQYWQDYIEGLALRNRILNNTADMADLDYLMRSQNFENEKQAYKLGMLKRVHIGQGAVAPGTEYLDMMDPYLNTIGKLFGIGQQAMSMYRTWTR